jgi:hypothetical protein
MWRWKGDVVVDDATVNHHAATQAAATTRRDEMEMRIILTGSLLGTSHSDGVEVVC